MAFVRLSDGTGRSLTAEQGIMAWNVLNGITEPDNAAWDEFCCHIQDIWLNPANAPQSYLDQHPFVPESYAATLGAKHVKT